MVAAYEDSFMYVGTRRNGSVHFWCILLGIKKTYKVDIQFLVGYLLRRALDSNQRIPYDIGSLANCWFKPLTQPSLNHLFQKSGANIRLILFSAKF